MSCRDPICLALRGKLEPDCKRDSEQCDYVVPYLDGSSTMGALVVDVLGLKVANGSVIPTTFKFG